MQQQQQQLQQCKDYTCTAAHKGDVCTEVGRHMEKALQSHIQYLTDCRQASVRFARARVWSFISSHVILAFAQSEQINLNGARAQFMFRIFDDDHLRMCTIATRARARVGNLKRFVLMKQLARATVNGIKSLKR